jgi:putative Holliday junction resolvase
MSRVLALDFGEARCGCALSDPTGTLATPLSAVERPDTRRGMQRIVALVKERDVGQVVVGLPLSLSGEEGPQALRTREWAGRLAARLGAVPVDLHDERLTTAQAARTGGSADEDSRAAAHLLEAYLAAAAGARS